MSELKPCPNELCRTCPNEVCRSTDIEVDMDGGFCGLECKDCYYYFTIGCDYETTVKAWNTRPFEDHAVEVLEKKLGFLMSIASRSEFDLDEIENVFLSDYEGSELQKLAIIKAKQLLGVK